MNTVQPIRDVETLIDLEDFFKSKSDRDHLMFCVGILLPLRVSDYIGFKVRDLKDKDNVYLRETKTNKEQFFQINDDLKKIINVYIKDKKDYEYIFPSRQKNKKGIYNHITRQQAYNILNIGAKEFGLENIGCHTLRKTFGFWYYQQTGDIETLRQIYNHADESITRRYIGISQDMVNNAVKTFKIKYKKNGNLLAFAS